MATNSEGLSRSEIQKRAADLLRAAGTDENTILLITGEPASAKMIVDNPERVAAIASANPDRSRGDYGVLSQGFPESTPRDSAFLAANPELLAAPPREYQVNAAGVIRYTNGVIFDPATGLPYYPPNDPEATGSMAWLNKIQDEWSEDKINSWRQRLNKYGYAIAKEGGFDQTFKKALEDYHAVRYSNFGKPLPVDQQAGLTKAEWGGTLDPSVLRGEARTWYLEEFGDEPSDEEVRRLAERLGKTAKRIAQNQGVDPNAAMLVAQSREREKFAKDPATQKWQELEETDTGLHDSFVNLYQVLSS